LASQSGLGFCYLCGQRLTDTNVTRDHVPPKFVFPKDLRTRFSPDLAVLPAHSTCNRGHQLDEEYFVYSLVTLAPDSPAGRALLREIDQRFVKGKSQRLLHQVLAELTDRPTGLHLPGDAVVKRLDRVRADRVAWKIVRGLHTLQYGSYLAPPRSRLLEYFEPGRDMPDHYDLVLSTVDRGSYSAVFGWKHVRITDRPVPLSLWALLLWDRWIICATLHDVGCRCDSCVRGPLASWDEVA